MDNADLLYAGAARQAEMVAGGEVSSEELVGASLERIAALDRELNAFRTVDGERALLEAQQADARRRGGSESAERPLLGVPMAVKDNVDVAGEVTTYGTDAYGEPADQDADVVARLRSAGAVVVGKTNMSELGLWPWTESATWGVTRSPWNRYRTPGGSSGGSGAAVAAGLVGAAHAADGGGSIRIPAACCGLFGLKPQNGRISLAPNGDDWNGLGTYGFVTRTVRDTGVLLDAVLDGFEGEFAQAAGRPPGRLRVAMSLARSSLTRLDDQVVAAVHSTGDLLRSLGHEVRDADPSYAPIELAFTPRYLRSAHEEAGALPRSERLERRTRSTALLGRGIPWSMVERSRETAAGFLASVERLMRDHDVILSPTLPHVPPPLGRAEGLGTLRTIFEHAAPTVAYTRQWNATGQPSASVPAGFTPEGLPLAVQLIGRPNDEATLLSLAAQLESERPWADRRPPLG